MNPQRWEKLEVMARSRRDEHFKTLNHLIQQEVEQLKQLSQIKDLIIDYQSQLKRLQSEPHIPAQVMSLNQFITRIEGFKTSTEERISAIRAKIDKAQITLIELEKERLKFATLKSKTALAISKQQAFEEEQQQEQATLNRYSRNPNQFGTALANDQ